MGEVKVAVRVWVMAFPLPNSSFCCYGFYKEKNETVNDDTIINARVTFDQLCQKNTQTISNLRVLIAF